MPRTRREIITANRSAIILVGQPSSCGSSPKKKPRGLKEQGEKKLKRKERKAIPEA